MTPNTSAPDSCAMLARTGATELPVPPPIPATRMTTSAPSVKDRNELSCLWAAVRAMLTLPPAPNRPSCTLLIGAVSGRSLLASTTARILCCPMLTHANSDWQSLACSNPLDHAAKTMLQPASPTPITRQATAAATERVSSASPAAVEPIGTLSVDWDAAAGKFSPKAETPSHFKVILLSIDMISFKVDD